MKKIALLLVLIAGMAPAAGGSALTINPATNGSVLWENPYDYDLLVDGLYSYDINHATDDFVLDNQSELEAIVFYVAYSGTHPRDLQVAIYQDVSGSPGSEQWRVTVDSSNITDTDTGDDNWGYDLWETRLELDPADVYEDLAPGTYWLEVYDPHDEVFGWFCENTGNFQYYGGTVFDFSAFFVVEGTPNSAVVGSSWGAIKALD